MPEFYYNRYGDPITEDQWSNLKCDERYVSVFSTTLSNNIRMELTWIGRVISFGPAGPEIFRTIVKEGNKVHQYTYATESQAMGHIDALISIWELLDTVPSSDSRFADMADEIS